KAYAADLWRNPSEFSQGIQEARLFYTKTIDSTVKQSFHLVVGSCRVVPLYAVDVLMFTIAVRSRMSPHEVCSALRHYIPILVLEFVPEGYRQLQRAISSGVGRPTPRSDAS